MTCSTCGRENAAHLTFCQECGQRLGPRIAPPTPPIGLGGQDAFGSEPSVAPAPRAATALGLAAVATPAQAAPPAAAPAPAGDRNCKVCNTPNGPTLRYCTSCGSTLDAAPVAASKAPAGASAAPIPSPANAIVPVGVVNLANGTTTSSPRTCARCKGSVDPAAQFCKFCGSALTDLAAHTTGSGRFDSARSASSAEAAPAPDPSRPPTAPMPAVQRSASPPEAARPNVVLPAWVRWVG
ncbi:MAG TPA: zinc ribbon domain-containing protein, partial [Labilithrix sp.]|nr:zinc ribbon domain-containing protein [Labilithrix sp.]